MFQLHPLHVNNYCIKVSQTFKSRKFTLRGAQVNRSVTVFYAILLNLCRWLINALMFLIPWESDSTVDNCTSSVWSMLQFSISIKQYSDYAQPQIMFIPSVTIIGSEVTVSIPFVTVHWYVPGSNAYSTGELTPTGPRTLSHWYLYSKLCPDDTQYRIATLPSVRVILGELWWHMQNTPEWI